MMMMIIMIIIPQYISMPCTSSRAIHIRDVTVCVQLHFNTSKVIGVILDNNSDMSV